MNHTDDRRDHRLPVTAEIGSEGGSYADPTMQVETFAESTGDSRSVGRETAAEPHDRGVDDSKAVRYATEPARGGAGREQRAFKPWTAAVVSAAAGLAIGLLTRRRRT